VVINIQGCHSNLTVFFAVHNEFIILDIFVAVIRLSPVAVVQYTEQHNTISVSVT
jgi:hypothetical protein